MTETPLARVLALTRFSGLDEINAQNVGRLGVSWTFSTGMVAGHEAAPLVVGSTMFIVTPFPNMVYAFDLSQAGAPMRWQYDPKPLGATQHPQGIDPKNAMPDLAIGDQEAKDIAAFLYTLR